MKLPLSNPEGFFQLLISNHNTLGTDEQKMLVLRRRFDYLLRQATGPFAPKESFYIEGMKRIQSALGNKAIEDDWKEFDRMRKSFNMVMHDDVEVDSLKYLCCLKRMAMFVSTITDSPIPISIKACYSGLRSTHSKHKNGSLIPVFCCIDRIAIKEKEEREIFNQAARQFRLDIISNTTLSKRICFKFIVSDKRTFEVRDLTDKPIEIIAETSSPREESMIYALNALNESGIGMLMTLFGGASLISSYELTKTYNALKKAVKVYPIVLASQEDPYSNLKLTQRVLPMQPDCYEEFFSWLYDSIVLYYSN